METDSFPEQTICRILTGPTASGKSELALQLAEEEGWDIICMDSMQIYRRMDIGTAKPGPEERGIVPHHLFDIREPWEPFSVSDYIMEAEKTIRKLSEEGKRVLFVGGTGLYLQALIHPMGMGNIPANNPLRMELNRIAAFPGGKEALHHRLEISDPESAARIPLNDIRRTIRAIEVSEGTGIPFSKQPVRREESGYKWKIASTRMERDVLYERINRRVDQMIRNGLADEVAGLLKEGVTENAQSMAALGYKEMIPYLRGKCTLDEAAEEIRKGSRHYAKRQMTFLRREPQIQYIDSSRDHVLELMKQILE